MEEDQQYNLIKITDFPELSELLSSDKIILFEEENGNLVPSLSAVVELSAVALFPQDMEEVFERVDRTKETINLAINYIKKTFIPKSDAKKTYATIKQLNDELKKLETISQFKNRLSSKATKELLEAMANKIKSKSQFAKYTLGVDSWENAHGYKRLLVAKAAVKEA